MEQTTKDQIRQQTEAEKTTESAVQLSEKKAAAEKSDTPVVQLVKMLKAADFSIATAESCTGGLLSSRLVDIPGVSAVFREGFVTYSNKAKRRTLGVSKSTIRKDGAVSEQTAKEMATGAAMAGDTDLALSVTGNAGPDAEEGKEVGLVYIGVYAKGKVSVETFHFKGSRQEIRSQAADAAVALGIKAVQKLTEKAKPAKKG